ncbi:MAG: right-handed parallel beta-helix repeat-containing protein, partial [Acidobacteriota bacterium]
MRRRAGIFIAVIVPLAGAGLALAALVAARPDGGGLAASAYFVAPGGDDSNPGSEALPWRTVARAMQALAPGVEVVFRQGTWNERAVVGRSGETAAPVALSVYPGETATLDGTGLAIDEDQGLVEVRGVSHVVVRGLRLVHSSGSGVFVDRASDVTVQAISTDDTVSSGVGVWASEDVLIADCEVVLACNDGGQECITVAGTDGFEVRGNHVHHGGSGTNGGEGIDAKDGAANGSIHHNLVHDLVRLGIYVDAWDKHTHDIDVHSNVVHATGNDGFTLASEMGGLLERVRVFNNVAWGNRYVGVSLSRNGDAAAHPMREVWVVNNTVVGNGSGEWGGGITVDPAEVAGVVIRNNIVSQNLSFQIVLDPGAPRAEVAVDHNLVDGFRGYDGEVQGKYAVAGDPLFADRLGHDFHLLAGS